MYHCIKCDAQYSKWQGRCIECGNWGTVQPAQGGSASVGNLKNKTKDHTTADKPVDLSRLKESDKARLTTHISEFDRVLGGGIVNGALILLGGDPGVGKSTLALQTAGLIANTLYISGEESASQVKLRAERLNIDLQLIKFLPQTNIETIKATIAKQKPPLVIIDSIQTMFSSQADSGPGSIGQLTACTSLLLESAKQLDIPIVIIGHVTKQGNVAGPKTMEHLVDTVLYLENDSQNHFKILRGVKNRFGSTGEIGVFEMTGSGLKEVANPTEIFAHRQGDDTKSGSVYSIIMEGNRPFLIEIQALTAKTVFGYPQRKTSGFDLNRLQMILAVIGKVNKLNLSNQDVYLNITGGLRVKETGADLAAAMSVVSSLLDISIEKNTLILGELGLSGEVRPVIHQERRIKEAKKLGFEKIICSDNAKTLSQAIIKIK